MKIKKEDIVPKYEKSAKTGYSYKQMHIFQLLKLQKEDFAELVKQYDSLEKIGKALNIDRKVLKGMTLKYLYSDTETYWDYFQRKKKESKQNVETKKYTKFFYTRLKQILNGVIPNAIKKNNLLYALFHYGLKKQCCELCGFSKHREEDNRVPLLLAQMDKTDLTNFKMENLKVVCYNCYFDIIGDVRYAFKTVNRNSDSHVLISKNVEIDYDIDWQIEDNIYETKYKDIDENDLISRKK
jgi:hypothetical protein